METDKEILEHLKQSAQEDMNYFSSKNKSERERWVVKEFLKALEVSFNDSEIQSQEEKNPIDVCFRDVGFQIKELLDEHSKRHEIYKRVFKNINKAKSLSDIDLTGPVSNTFPNYIPSIELVFEQAKTLSESSKYLKLKGSIDLLFYVTRRSATLLQESDFKRSGDFKSLGWRSVAVLNTKQAVVLYASSYAPACLKQKSEIILPILSN